MSFLFAATPPPSDDFAFGLSGDAFATVVAAMVAAIAAIVAAVIAHRSQRKIAAAQEDKRRHSQARSAITKSVSHNSSSSTRTDSPRSLAVSRTGSVKPITGSAN